MLQLHVNFKINKMFENLTLLSLKNKLELIKKKSRIIYTTMVTYV